MAFFWNKKKNQAETVEDWFLLHSYLPDTKLFSSGDRKADLLEYAIAGKVVIFPRAYLPEPRSEAAGQILDVLRSKQEIIRN